MLSIPQALARIKGQVTRAVPPHLILRLCRRLGHRWRKRDLGPVLTTHLFLQQVLYGNTAAAHLRRLSGLAFTDSAYCQARARLPRELLDRLQQAVTDGWRHDGGERPEARWRGHRAFFLDGSSFSMPDTRALRAHFGQPAGQAAGCGFPVAHLMVLFDARRGYLLKALAQPLHTHDLSQAAALHAELRAGDVLVGDRAFASYAHLALCRGRGLHGVFRAHQRQIVSFLSGRAHLPPGASAKGRAGLPRSRWLKRLGRRDQLVEYFKPKERPTWLTAEQYAALPDTLVVRELRYQVRRPGCRTRVVTLVTTLLDPEAYPAAELARWYGLRWGAEQTFKDVKEVWGAGHQQVRNVHSSEGCFNLNLWLYSLVEAWAWDRPAAALVDRSASPWDREPRRPSHQDKRKALQREVLRGEIEEALAGRPSKGKIRALAQRLLDLAG
jgi:hypothetical protein